MVIYPETNYYLLGLSLQKYFVSLYKMLQGTIEMEDIYGTTPKSIR